MIKKVLEKRKIFYHMMNLLPLISPVLFLLLCLLGMARVNAQVVATGHVTAEVVESVSASAKVNTGFDLRSESFEETGTLLTSDLNLGTITVNSGKNVACNVVMHPASLTDSMGNNLEVETSYSSPLRKKAGSQVLQLTAKARTRTGQSTSLYQGSYTMVFAYN
jgi:hypothetical protein